MTEKIYLPDTNVLHNLAEATLSQSAHAEAVLKYYQFGALKFFNRYGARVQIPSIVWGEFCGLWFHKNVDFTRYDKWFETRLSCFLQVYAGLKRQKVTLCEDSDTLYQETLNISNRLTTTKMPEPLIAGILGRLDNAMAGLTEKCAAHPEDSKLRKDLERNEFNRTRGKLLDGLDSMIAGFACALARQKPAELIVVVTEDKFMVDVLAYFFNHPEALAVCGMPANVTASLPYRVAHL